MQFLNKHRLWLTALLMTFCLGVSPAFATKIEIVISKTSQKMTVYIDGDKEFVWLVSTGGSGYDTPTGTFRPFRMEKEHFSKEWDDAPMPYSMFFTGEGHAIHGSYHIKALGRRASHGCVRLAPENAAKLFALVSKAGSKNTTIKINGGFFDFDGRPSRETVKSARKPFTPFWLAAKKDVKVVKKKKKKAQAFLFGGL
jgi:L,D-transpeptidase catalytic domain